MLTPALYGFGTEGGNVVAERRLDRLSREPLRGEPTPGPRAHAVPPNHPLRADELGLERGDRLVRRLRVDAVPPEVEPDRRVAVTTAGEGLCARACEPHVVHVAEPLEPLECLGAPLRIDAGAFEPRVDLVRRTVAVPERPCCELDGIRRVGDALHCT